MARGLSDLQKKILLMAYERRRSNPRDFAAERAEAERFMRSFNSEYTYTPRADITCAEILAEVYGWRHRWKFPAELAERDRQQGHKPSQNYHHNSQYFYRRAIGEEEYNKAGVCLTDEGVEAARRLSVTK